jgi:hypothetical protein
MADAGMSNQSDIRAKRARSLLNAQHLMQRVEERRLAELKRRKRELDETEQRLRGLIDADDTLQALLTFMCLRSINGVEKERNRVAAQSQSQTERLIEQTVRSKLAERISETAGQNAQRERDKQDLDEILERCLRGSSARLPQGD